MTSVQFLSVCLVAICVIHITDTHIPSTRNIPVVSGGSDALVRSLLSRDYLRNLRRRWRAQGLDQALLESMLRSTSRDFISQHGRETPRTSLRGRSRIGPTGPRDLMGRRGGTRGGRRNRDRNVDHIGHEGHDHGNIGRDRTRPNGMSPRRDRRNRRNRRLGGEDMIPLGGRGRETGVGDEERIPQEELRRLLRESGRHNEANRLTPRGRGDRGGRRNRDRTGRPDRTLIDPLGRPIDLTRVRPDDIMTGDPIGRRPGGRHTHRHGDGHDHGHIGDIHPRLGNRQRGGVIRVDGTRERVGLRRIRGRNNDVRVVPPTPPQGRRRRRRRSGLGGVIRNVLGTILG